MTDPQKSTWLRVRERLTPERIVRIAVVLMIVGLCSYFFDEIKEQLPILTTLQLQTFDWLSRLQSHGGLRAPIIGVEIDDQTFYQHLRLTGAQDVTDRGFLAGIIDRAVAAHAAVIALDINLVAESADYSDRERKRANRELFEAFAKAHAAGITVVLTQGFDFKTMSPLANIEYCQNAALSPKDCQPLITVFDCRSAESPDAIADPYGVRAGFDLEPEDTRKVPLTVYSSNDRLCPSFALQVANAYDDVLGQTRVLSSSRVSQTTENGQRFVYAGFVPDYSHRGAASAVDAQQTLLDDLNNRPDPSASPAVKDPQPAMDPYRFPHVSALKVFENDPHTIERLAHHIVLIGGHRHANAQCSLGVDGQPNCTPGGDWLDYHPGPTGPMVGMYVHANYVKALLEQRYQLPITRWQAVAIDIGIALFVIAIELLWTEHWWQRVFLLVIGAIVLVLVYRAATALQLSRWIALAIDLCLAILITLFAFRARQRHRGVVVLFLAVIAVALVYIAQTLRGYSIDVLAVLVVLFLHHAYDYWREKKVEWKELTRRVHV